MFRNIFDIYLPASIMAFLALLLWAAGYMLFSNQPTDLLEMFPPIPQQQLIGIGFEIVAFAVGFKATLMYGTRTREGEELGL